MTYRFPMALVAAILLAGCSSQAYRVPVEDRSAGDVPVDDVVEPAPSVVVRPVESTPLQVRPLPSSTAPVPQRSYTPRSDYRPAPAAPAARPTPEPAPDLERELARELEAETAPPTRVSTSRNPAVVALLTSASEQSASGSLNAAQTSLERAQRIAPRDPEVYYQLADLQRRKGNYPQAEQMALRGLEVAGGKPSMQRTLWGLIGRVRVAAGDPAGARQALEKAQQY